MSYDSVTRINKFFKDNVADPDSIYTIYEDLNEGLDEPADSPFCKTFFEASFDDPTGVSITPETNVCFREEGLFIVQIFAVRGMGNKYSYALEDISQKIRNAFRGVRLLPEVGEEGIILFEDFTTRQTIEIDREGSNRGRGSTFDGVWKRKDIFINYQKNYT